MYNTGHMDNLPVPFLYRGSMTGVHKDPFHNMEVFMLYHFQIHPGHAQMYV